MIPREWIGAGSSVENAVRKGLGKLGLLRDQVDVKVLGEKTSTLFSLFGFRRVEVKLLVKPGVLRERERQAAAGARQERRDGGRDDRRDDKRGRDGRRDGRDRNERRDGGRNDARRDAPRENDRSRGDGRDNNRRQGRSERPADARPSGRHEDRDRQDRPRRNDRPQRPQRPERPPRERIEENRPPSAPRNVPTAETLLAQWKDLLGWENLSWSVRDGQEGEVTVLFGAADAGLLTSDQGRTLRSLEHLLNVVRSRGDRSVPRVLLRVEGQEEPDADGLADRAQRAAEEVKSTGQPVYLDPMSARDRKVVHQTLAGRPDVETSSEGEGPFRKVVVRPKGRFDN